MPRLRLCCTRRGNSLEQFTFSQCAARSSPLPGRILTKSYQRLRNDHKSSRQTYCSGPSCAHIRHPVPVSIRAQKVMVAYPSPQKKFTVEGFSFLKAEMATSLSWPWGESGWRNLIFQAPAAPVPSLNWTSFAITVNLEASSLPIVADTIILMIGLQR